MLRYTIGSHKAIVSIRWMSSWILCPFQRLFSRLKKVLHLFLPLLRDLFHLILCFAHIIWPGSFLLLHVLETLVHSAPRVTDGISCLVTRCFCALHRLVSGFFRRGRDRNVQLQVVVGVYLGRQGQV